METKKTWFQRNKGIAIFVSLLVVIIIVLFAWSQIERRNFNKRMDEQRAEIIGNARKLIDENRKNLLYDVSRSLSWALRSEASRNNFDQANQYLNEFVKAREFELALFTDNDGNIILATDKRMEGTLAQDQFAINVADVQDVNIQVMSDNKWMAMTPVMGLNTRLGTLILIYDPRDIPVEDFLKN